MALITPKITNLGYSNLWTDMSTILGYTSNFDQQIQKLFANGEQGFYYDPNDLSTMFQDSAGTVPVTDVGQPVGLIRDKSGRNNHAYQTNSASRPILRQNAVTGANYLEFDGSDDFLQTSDIDFTATDKLSLFAGVRKLGTKRGTIVEFGTLGLGRFMINSNRVDATSFSFLGENVTPFPTVSAQDSAVLTGVSNLTNRTHKLTVDSKNTNSETWTQVLVPSYQDAPLHIGRQRGAGFAFNGHIYGLIGIGKLASATEATVIEKELAKRVGVTLNV